MNILDPISYLYNFTFNYEVKATFAAAFRMVTFSFFTIWMASNLKDALFFSHPKKIFSGESFLKLCKWWPQLSLFKLFPYSEKAQKTIFAFFFISGLTSAIGLFTNISAAIFLIMWVSLQTRLLPMMTTAADPIIRMMLFSLVFVDCGSVWSIDNILGISSNKDLINGWGFRMIQFTIVWAYFISAIEKMKDPFWTTGIAIKNIFYTDFWSKAYMNKKSQLFESKFSMVLNAYAVILFEFFAPILFYFKDTRIIGIISGILLHLGIIIFMRLSIFGYVMIIGVLSFTNQYFPF